MTVVAATQTHPSLSLPASPCSHLGAVQLGIASEIQHIADHRRLVPPQDAGVELDRLGQELGGEPIVLDQALDQGLNHTRQVEHILTTKTRVPLQS